MNSFATPSDRGAVAALRIPGAGVLSRADLSALALELEEAERDTSVRTVLLNGDSTDFCGGLDLCEFEDTGGLDDLAGVLSRCFLSFARLRKPLVMSISGSACGFGATMLCHADVVVACERTRIRMPFLDLGLYPEAGSTLLLSQRIGHLNAFRLLCLTEEIDAIEARRIGLVTYVEPADTAPARASSIARALARHPASLTTKTKDLMQSERGNLPDRITLEVDMCLERIRDPVVRRRLARFSGRSKGHPQKSAA